MEHSIEVCARTKTSHKVRDAPPQNTDRFPSSPCAAGVGIKPSEGQREVLRIKAGNGLRYSAGLASLAS